MLKSRNQKSSSNTGSSSKNDNKLRQTTMGNYMDVDDHGKRSTRSLKGGRFRYNQSFFRKWSDKDTEQYRNGYPGKKDKLNKTDNLSFYTNKIKSYPDGDYIDNIHSKWFGDHYRLESHHGYIQWLFPIRESGMNFYSQELQLHEIKSIMEDPEAHARVLKSYELMLEFYGMELESKETGKIKRGQNWKHRFRHLNHSYHNYLRITRILKSLGEFGYEHLKKPFIEFVLEEGLEHETLPNTLESCVNYWIGTVKNDNDRKGLLDYVMKMDEGYGTKHPPDAEDSDTDEDMADVLSKDHVVVGAVGGRTGQVSEDITDSSSDMDSQEGRMWAEAAAAFDEDILRTATNGKSDEYLNSFAKMDTTEEDLHPKTEETTSTHLLQENCNASSQQKDKTHDADNTDLASI